MYNWYAARVRGKHEKLVSRDLTAKGIDHYLPLLKLRHRWSDRYVEIEEPLFSGYLFVHIVADARIAVLEARGVVEMVGTIGKPWPIPDQEIDSVRVALASSLAVDPHPYLRVGCRVAVVKGPLQGCEGILVQKINGHRLVLSVHLLCRSISVEISPTDLVPLAGDDGRPRADGNGTYTSVVRRKDLIRCGRKESRLQ